MAEVEHGTRGRLLKGYVKFIKKKWGQDGVLDCQDYVGLDLQKVSEDKWYENEDLDLLLRWIEENHGIEYCRKAGYALVAERGIISFAARIAGIERVLAQSKKEFEDSFNFGKISVERGDKSAIIKLNGVTESDAACHAWIGAFEGILKISGAKGTVEKIGCRRLGAEACIYELKWN